MNSRRLPFGTPVSIPDCGRLHATVWIDDRVPRDACAQLYVWFFEERSDDGNGSLPSRATRLRGKSDDE
jgi:hypothetical protein